MIEPNHSRRVSPLEAYYISRNTGNYYSSFNILAKYTRKVTPGLLSNALKSLLKNNSWFTYNFFRIEDVDDAKSNGSNYVIRPVDRIEFSQVVTLKKVDVLDERELETLNQLKCPMDVTNLPLWRVVVYELDSGDQYVGMYCDHSIFDGLSALQFHKDLITELSNASDDMEEILFNYERDVKNLPAKVHPSTDSMTNIYATPIRILLGSLLKRHIPMPVVKLYNYISGLFGGINFNRNPVFYHSTITKDLNTKFKIINFKPDEVKKITNFCKSQSITITPFFDYACLKSLENTVFQKLNNKTKFSTTSLIAINGRRYFPEYMKRFLYGVFVSGDIVTLPPLNGDPIKEMKSISDRITANLNSKESFKINGLIKYINRWNFFKDKLNKKDGRLTLMITNLGRLQKGEKKFEIEDAIFSSNTSILYHFIFNIITTEEGGMNIVLSYLPEYDELLEGDKKVIDTFVETFKSMILSYSV